MADTFATVADLEAGWRTLTASEQNRAETLLGRASTILSSAVDVVAGDETQAELLMSICCSMVQRAMSVGDAFGVTQQTQTAGSFSHSTSYANPTGDLYLTKQERQLLGIGGRQAGFKSLGGYESGGSDV